MPLRWYIMTSPATDAETKKHFRTHGFFGLKESQVVFFSQGALPALTEDGRIVMESPSRLAMAPDGNGGVYMALRSAGVLADMAAHGVEAVDCYCVDNALVRLGDPLFVGFCHARGLECGEWAWAEGLGAPPCSDRGAGMDRCMGCRLPRRIIPNPPRHPPRHHPAGARVVAKAYPEEKVGVFARRGGALEVVEYSGALRCAVLCCAMLCCWWVCGCKGRGQGVEQAQGSGKEWTGTSLPSFSPLLASPLLVSLPPLPELDPAEAAASDPATGELKYGWSNICLHYFRRDWLEAVSDRLAALGRYHTARKKIASKDGPVAVRVQGAGRGALGAVGSDGAPTTAGTLPELPVPLPCPPPTQGVKLELFIFDTFPLAASTALFEVRRDEEFAPVKNAPGQGLPDSPDTARDAILALHKR